MYKILSLIVLLCAFCSSRVNSAESVKSENKVVKEWKPAEMLNSNNPSYQILGEPKVVDSKYGQAVYFDGIDDAIQFPEMPLEGLGAFTVEMIFHPDMDAPFEQRVVHVGGITVDRMLLEIRAVESNWYFDGFVASGNNKTALIDETLIHPLGQWHHVALVVDSKSMTTFVNGQKELSTDYSFLPIKGGISSIGVRQNKVSWYKGKIYKVRISSGALAPEEFMKK